MDRVLLIILFALGGLCSSNASQLSNGTYNLIGIFTKGGDNGEGLIGNVVIKGNQITVTAWNPRAPKDKDSGTTKIIRNKADFKKYGFSMRFFYSGAKHGYGEFYTRTTSGNFSITRR
jgi:hypothetical protein